MEGEEQKKLLDVITEEVNRLNRVVSQFLNYARPYSPDLKPRPINTVIEKAMAVIEADSLSARIHVQMELPSPSAAGSPWTRSRSTRSF